MDAATSEVVCIGTAWVEGRASMGHPPEPPAPATDLQFAWRGLDISLLADLQTILTGTTLAEIASAARAGQVVDTGVRRIGGAQLGPYHVAHFYECSGELRRRLAALTAERIKDIAANWYILQGHPNTHCSPGRVEYRCEVIENLVALARVADDRNSRVLLRVEYRSPT